MGKDKLRRFAENRTFECFVQPEFEEMFRCDHPLNLSDAQSVRGG